MLVKGVPSSKQVVNHQPHILLADIGYTSTETRACISIYIYVKQSDAITIHQQWYVITHLYANSTLFIFMLCP